MSQLQAISVNATEEDKASILTKLDQMRAMITAQPEIAEARAERQSSRKVSPPTPIIRQTSSPPRPLEGNELRVRCSKLLVDALKCGDMPDGTLDPEDLAARIEEKLFDLHRGTTDKYMELLRSRVVNLRYKKNPALRENILTGVVAPERFAIMTSQEMASSPGVKHKSASDYK
uniref:TFIIS central domain-containing protein n=1 Tax=Plectus sambesii TaxID=2011161 RepID=A0A914VFK8_9BILA